MRIFKTKTSEILSKWDLEAIRKLKATWFVYCYQTSDYEGHGFAVWKSGAKYYYGSLGHCSCNGPVEDLVSLAYKWTEIIKIAGGYGDEAVEVIKFIRKLRKKNGIIRRYS